MNKQPSQANEQGNQRQSLQGQQQLSLFAMPVQTPVNRSASKNQRIRAGSRTVLINPHLLAARRIAKRMRRLPEHSDAETRAGLAICAQLKAFLAEGNEESSATPRH